MNLKNTRISAFLKAVLLLVVLAVFGFSVNAQTTKKLRIVDAGLPVVAFNEVPSTAEVVSLLSCQSKEYIDRYYSGSNSAYLAAEQKKGQCWTGYAQATVFLAKIADTQTSIAEIDKRLASLDKTMTYFNSLKDLDGLAVIMIPAGKPETKQHQGAKDIATMCLKDATNNTTEVGVPVGTSAFDNLSVFNNFPNDQLASLAELRKQNAELSAKIAADIAKDGKIGKGTIMSIANQAMRTQKIMESNFIPITVDDFEKNYRDVLIRKAFERMSINYTLNDANGKILHNIPAFFSLFAKLAGVSGPLVEGKMSIGDYGYDTWMPESKMMKDIREATAQHIVRSKKLREQFQKILDSLELKLKALKDSNYNCVN